MENQIIIEFCVPCGFEKQAQQLADELTAMYGSKIGGVTLEPTRMIGSFEVFFNGELIYSKKKSGKLPEPGQVEQIMFARLKQ